MLQPLIFFHYCIRYFILFCLFLFVFFTCKVDKVLASEIGELIYVFQVADDYDAALESLLGGVLVQQSDETILKVIKIFLTSF